MTSPTLEIISKDRAAVFFHAPWSGPSVHALSLLRKAAADRGLSEHAIHVIDVDADDMAADVLRKEGFAFGGAGEAAIIRGGKIAYYSMLGGGGSGIDTRIAKFLDEERA